MRKLRNHPEQEGCLHRRSLLRVLYLLSRLDSTISLHFGRDQTAQSGNLTAQFDYIKPMKKLIAVAALTLGLASSVLGQCFTLVDVVSNPTIKADPSPGSWWGVALIGDEGPYPANTRLFSWDLGRLVKGRFQAYGFKRDDPSTPQNENGQVAVYEDFEIAPCYHATITRRFSQCDVGFMSTYTNTSSLKEFVIQVELFDAFTGAYVNTAYMRWLR